MNNNNFRLRNLIFIGYCLLMVSFFMPLKINGALLILCGLLSTLIINKLPLKKLLQFPLILLPLLFVLLLVGMLYTENDTNGWAIIERHYSLLFVPFIASSYTFLSKNQQKWVLNTFVIGATLSAFYCITYAIVDYFETGSAYVEGKSGHHTYNKFMHHLLTEPLRMHAIYFALYLSFSFIYLLDNFIQYFRSYSKLIKISFILLFAFYALMIILLKSALFALALPLAIIVLLFLHFRQRIFSKSKYMIKAIGLITILGAFSFYGLQSKILNFSTDLNLTEQHPGSLKIRLGIWYSSWETIKDHWVMGVGTGDGYDALLHKYDELNFYIGKKDQFNAHNMYLEYWISNGIFATLIYLTILLSFTCFFYRNKNYLALLCVFLFAAFSFTESTMLRQNGIVFFILFNSMLYFNINQFNQSKID